MNACTCKACIHVCIQAGSTYAQVQLLELQRQGAIQQVCDQSNVVTRICSDAGSQEPCGEAALGQQLLDAQDHVLGGLVHSPDCTENQCFGIAGSDLRGSREYTVHYQLSIGSKAALPFQSAPMHVFEWPIKAAWNSICTAACGNAAGRERRVRHKIPLRCLAEAVVSSSRCCLMGEPVYMEVMVLLDWAAGCSAGKSLLGWTPTRYKQGMLRSRCLLDLSVITMPSSFERRDGTCQMPRSTLSVSVINEATQAHRGASVDRIRDK